MAVIFEFFPVVHNFVVRFVLFEFFEVLVTCFRERRLVCCAGPMDVYNQVIF